ncbi:MAG: hypothetical protein HND48_20760 [Chloroflexi bacterium]|nr:hypothetical protein [Chloroflexota bacterium]
MTDSLSDSPLTVLVLGVGGNVSQGILKALALSTLPVRVIGACVGPGVDGAVHLRRGLHLAARR